MLSITQLQPGVACVYKHKPYIILESSHEKHGRGGGIQHVKMRCLYDGTTLQQNFRSQPGVACVYKHKPYIILESSHEKHGRGGGIQHVKMRCLYDGTTLQQNF